MYLKSVEIQGFKSFAHKTRLTFDHCLTAIVGPNGSGKSNISDAVRWVIGEQSARQLRGAQMQDVIFSGTELRKPLGYASVTITIDNSDHELNSPFAEIAVSRRLFRSGESEYLINGQSSRLKDIEELFFDTGIGRDGYSIIGQGRVEVILNGRPEERRGLFDEAAGIVKFKSRKHESLKKLASEEANLAKVREILEELEERLVPLKKQQDDARLYLSLREEIKSLDLNLFIRESEAQIRELTKAESDKQIVEESLSELMRERDALSGANQDTAARIREFNERITAKKEEIAKADLLKQNLLGQISVRETEIKAADESLAAIAEDMARLREERDEHIKSAREHREALIELEQELTALRADDRAQGGENLDEIDAISERIAGFKERLAIPLGSEEDADFGSAAPPRTEEETPEDDEYELPEWLLAITAKRSRLSEIKEKEAKNLLWQSAAESEYNELTLKLKALRDKFNQKQKVYLDQKAKYDSLKGFSERYEGFGESVRTVMGLRDSIPGIRGTAADIISTDKKYELAIEAALGNRIQNIVTDTEADAGEIIAYLKRTKKGRVTILPLDKIGGSTSAELRAASKEPGSLGIASEVVEYDEVYIGAVKYLLGGVMVAVDLKNALKIADKYHHRLRIVTLEGDLVTPGGAITGGAYKNSLNLMGRKSRLKELREAVSAARREMGAVEDEIGAVETDIAAKNVELDRISETLREIDHDKQELSLSIVSDARIKTGEFSQKASFIEENIERIVRGYQSFDERSSALTARKDEICLRRDSAVEDIGKRQEDILYIGRNVAALRDEIADIEEERDSVSSDESERYRRMEEINNSILDLNKELLRFESIIERRNQKIEEDSQYIRDEYGIGAEQAGSWYDESLGSVRNIRSRISEIRDILRDLAPINIDSIEEYRDKSARYEFLKAQETDLVSSGETVKQAIAELDTEMKAIFNEKFALINKEFGRVFSELFEGGSAMLSLSDEGADRDELSAGIMISAQPPGKKLKNIMQLSGGERALTAIALLFAIQSLKPSPFCLLDEIEANLDDVNVTRFTRYLKRLEGRTQFICITHKRGTMEAAARLYGVTMQERGVSKLVSVDLISDEITE